MDVNDSSPREQQLWKERKKEGKKEGSGLVLRNDDTRYEKLVSSASRAWLAKGGNVCVGGLWIRG